MKTSRTVPFPKPWSAGLTGLWRQVTRMLSFTASSSSDHDKTLKKIKSRGKSVRAARVKWNAGVGLHDMNW